MRIRDTLLAVAATLVAGSAIAAPALAQDYRHGYERSYAPAFVRGYERAYAPAYGYGYGYQAPYFEGRRDWVRPEAYRDHYRHDDGYRHF